MALAKADLIPLPLICDVLPASIVCSTTISNQITCRNRIRLFSTLLFKVKNDIIKQRDQILYLKRLQAVFLGITFSWLFSQDLGFFARNLGILAFFYQESWVFAKNLGFFLSRILVFLIGITNDFFHIFPVHITFITYAN